MGEILSLPDRARLFQGKRLALGNIYYLFLQTFHCDQIHSGFTWFSLFSFWRIDVWFVCDLVLFVSFSFSVNLKAQDCIKIFSRRQSINSVKLLQAKTGKVNNFHIVKPENLHFKSCFM